jgi:hypothetical protein
MCCFYYSDAFVWCLINHRDFSVIPEFAWIYLIFLGCRRKWLRENSWQSPGGLGARSSSRDLTTGPPESGLPRDRYVPRKFVVTWTWHTAGQHEENVTLETVGAHISPCPSAWFASQPFHIPIPCYISSVLWNADRPDSEKQKVFDVTRVVVLTSRLTPWIHLLWFAMATRVALRMLHSTGCKRVHLDKTNPPINLVLTPPIPPPTYGGGGRILADNVFSLLICNLVNDAVGDSDYISSDGSVIGE